MLRKIFAVVITVSLVGFSSLAGADKFTEYLQKTSKAFSNIVKESEPSVVSISVEKKVAVSGFGQGGRFPFDNDMLERFFPNFKQPEKKRKVRGMGSGFIISEDGHILTNNHVVAKAQEITVRTFDDKEYEAELVGADPKSDVAVIRIEGNGLKALEFGNSDALEAGEWVIAIGSPFGLARTVSVGVVSAKGRSGMGITDYEDFIQTDAAINRGNSGGPLINSNGKVVGMNTAIFSQTGGYMGIGFAIPVNMIRKIKKQLIETGEVTRGYLGIFIQPLTREIKENLDLDVDKGILISKVQEDGPAEDAGLKRYDVIVGINGTEVEDLNEFRNSVSFMKPGKEVALEIIRDGKQKKLDVEIGRLPDEDREEVSVGDQKGIENQIGFSVQDLTDRIAEKFGYDKTEGVIVNKVTPRSEAARKGIRPGVLILEVNREKVKSASDFYNKLKKTGKGKSALLLVKYNESTWFVTLEIE